MSDAPDEMMGWVAAMKFMDTVDQVAAYKLCLEGEEKYGWEVFTKARKGVDWDAGREDALQSCVDALDEPTQSQTMSMLINSEAKLTKERDEARDFAIAVLRETRQCECEFHYEPHWYTEACVAPWEVSQ